MGAIFNQYSYVWMSLIIILIVVGLLYRLDIQRPLIAIVALALAVLLGYGLLLLRPGQSDVGSVEAAEALLKNGRPTFLEFFSNY